MNKNEHFIPITVVFLTIAFALISLAVFLSRGKSAYWISKKMKIGALLLTLTATATTQKSCVCYAPDYFPTNGFDIEVNIVPGTNYYGVIVDLNEDNKINGVIYERGGG